MEERNPHCCDNCGFSGTRKAYSRLRHKIPRQTRFTILEAVNSVLTVAGGTRASIPLSQYDRELCRTCVFKLKTWFNSSSAFLSKTATGTYFDQVFRNVDRDSDNDADGYRNFPRRNFTSSRTPSKKTIPCCASCGSIPNRLLIDFRTVVNGEILLVANSDAFNIVFGPGSTHLIQFQTQGESGVEPVLLCDNCSKPFSELYNLYLQFMEVVKEASYLHQRIGKHFYKVQNYFQQLRQQQIKDEPIAAAEEVPSPPYIPFLEICVNEHEHIDQGQWQDDRTDTAGETESNHDPIHGDQGESAGHIHFMDSSIPEAACTDQGSAEKVYASTDVDIERIGDSEDEDSASVSVGPGLQEAHLNVGDRDQIVAGGEGDTEIIPSDLVAMATAFEKGDMGIKNHKDQAAAAKPPKNNTRKQRHHSKLLDITLGMKREDSADTAITEKELFSWVPENPSYCDICKINFNDVSSLKKHQSSKHPALSESYRCPKCGEYFFRGKAQLIRHLRVMHSIPGEKLSTDTVKIFSQEEPTESPEDHGIRRPSPVVVPLQLLPEDSPYKIIEESELFSWEPEKPTYCGVCKMDLGAVSKLKEHQAYAHPALSSNYGCPKCCEHFFRQKRHLIKHMRDSHSILVRSHHLPLPSPKVEQTHKHKLDTHFKRPNPMLKCKEKRNIRSIPIQRNKPASNFTTPKATLTPDLSKMPKIVSIGLIDKEEEPPIPIFNAPSDTHNTHPYKCDKCDRLFRAKSALIAHSKTHSPPEFPCTLCTTAFYTATRLNWHLVVSHQVGEKLPENTCPACGKYFSCLRRLQSHCASQHGEKRFECPLCSKKFGSFVEMFKHKKREELVKSGYLCSECGKKYRSSNSLRDHKKRMHSSKKMVHPCPKCKKSFISEGQLSRHLKLGHKIFEKERIKDQICEYCGIALYTSQGLRVHRNTHNPTENFACEICGMKFIYRHYLKKHMVTHNEARPFECQDCGKTFKKVAYLEGHRLRIHATAEERGGPWECDLCGQIFRIKELLSKHKKSKFHGGKGTYVRPYKPTRKPKRAVNSTGVEGILDINGKTCFKCDSCFWIFASELQLKYHKIQRHGKSKCDQCGINVASVEDLKQHQQEAHLARQNKTTTTDKSTVSRSTKRKGKHKVTRRSRKPAKYCR